MILLPCHLVEWRGSSRSNSPKRLSVSDSRSHRERHRQLGDGFPRGGSGYDHHEADEREAAEIAVWIYPEIRCGNAT